MRILRHPKDRTGSSPIRELWGLERRSITEIPGPGTARLAGSPHKCRAILRTGTPDGSSDPGRTRFAYSDSIRSSMRSGIEPSSFRVPASSSIPRAATHGTAKKSAGGGVVPSRIAQARSANWISHLYDR